MTNWAEVKTYILTQMRPGVLGNTDVQKQLNALFAIVNQLNAASIDPESDFTWDPSTSYGADTVPVIWQDRWLVSNIAGNTGNVPISTGGVIHPTWREIASSPGSGIRIWDAMVYPNILEVVFYNGALYYLDRTEVGDDPFVSVDIADEILAGQWLLMTGGGGGGGTIQIVMNQKFDFDTTNVVELDFAPDDMFYVMLNWVPTDRFTLDGDELTVTDWVSGPILVGYFRHLTISPGGGVQTVTGDGVDNTDTNNPVMDLSGYVDKVSNEDINGLKKFMLSLVTNAGVMLESNTTQSYANGYATINYNSAQGRWVFSSPFDDPFGQVHAIFRMMNMTADRIYDLPDRDGELALVEDMEAEEIETNAIPFDRLGGYIIGNAAVRTGSLTHSFTNAKLGAWAMVRHLETGSFTFGAGAELTFDPTDPNQYSITETNLLLLVLTDKTPSAEIVTVSNLIVQP